MRRTLDVWYVCDEVLCNFDCAYCTTQAPRRASGRRVWASADGQQRYDAIVAWLAGLPWRLRLRLQTLGEPFMSQAFLRGAAWLSRQDNIAFVELVTNGSFTPRRLDQFAKLADLGRISLWITYHDGEIDPAVLVENARRAQAQGAYVVVHALLFPDNLAQIDRLADLCRAAGLRTDVTVGHNLNDAYPDHAMLPVLQTEPGALLSRYRDSAAIEALGLAYLGPRGAPCSAGHDYLRVFSDGAVYPCAPYRGAPETCLGNALDEGFVPALRAETYAPCASAGICACKEDYFHLEKARSRLSFPRSLGYYEARSGDVIGSEVSHPEAFATG